MNDHTLFSLLAKAGLTRVLSHDPVITGLASDSRLVQPGNLFFALGGSHHDPSRYASQAIERGATSLVTDNNTTFHECPSEIPIIRCADPHKVMGNIAAAFFGEQPGHQIAVTGTNGKTSTTDFIRQILNALGRKAACIGTLGVTGHTHTKGQPHLTTPGCLDLARDLAQLKKEGYDDVAMEASSHGLAQDRLASTHLTAGAFTSFSRDHLDYHKTLSHYRNAKLKLFSTNLPQKSLAVAYDDLDGETLRNLEQICQKRHLCLHLVGEKAHSFLRILRVQPTPKGQILKLHCAGKHATIALPLIGYFQAINALIALCAINRDPQFIFNALPCLEQLCPVSGRLECIEDKSGKKIAYIDYAHTPDALKTVLKAVRPHCLGRLLVVFGAGGERDKGKRPLMSEAVRSLADEAFITDDNPRGEDPAAIRQELVRHYPQAHVIAGRESAIAAAAGRLKAGDILVVTGKGHEKHQIIGQRHIPFDDVKVTSHYLNTP